jgi:hypothetical protein
VIDLTDDDTTEIDLRPAHRETTRGGVAAQRGEADLRP